MLQRWVRRPDGGVELLELPLTRELFLDPQYGDKILQGNPHVLVVTSLYERLKRYFRPEADTLVLTDLKHYLGAGESYAPAPDVSIVRGLPRPDPSIKNFNVQEQGAVPCLVIEVVSPDKAEIRKTDEVDKTALYARVGIPEYFMVYLPRGSALRPLRLSGLRRGADGRYRPVPADARGRILSEATGLCFAVSPAQDDIDIFVAATGERLLTPVEEQEERRAAEAGRRAAEAGRRAAEERQRTAEERQRAAEERQRAAEELAAREAEARRAAQERAEQEAQARQAAAEELARLRAEIERLKTSAG